MIKSNSSSRCTSWNIKAPPAKRPCSPEMRQEQGRRFKATFSTMGFTVDDVAQLLQVTPRTVQLWISGRVRLPFMAMKLMRLYLRYELPGDAWNGWTLSAGRLYTPEGYELAPQDFTWWGLLVRKSKAFHQLYKANNVLRSQQLDQGFDLDGSLRKRAPAGAKPGLVPSINNADTQLSGNPFVQGNQRLTQSDITGVEWRQNDHKLISPCPTRSDSPRRSTKKRATTLNVSESVSTLLSQWPSMPTCEDRISHLLPKASRSNLARQQGQKSSLNNAANASQQHLDQAIGESSTTQTCGPMSIQTSRIDSATTWTKPNASRLSLNTGRRAAVLSNTDGLELGEQA